MVRNIYLINLSFGLAGIERRFANIWRGLLSRNNVNVILVVPDTLADLLHAAGLIDKYSSFILAVPEFAVFRKLDKLRLPPFLKLCLVIVRSRFMAFAFRKVWKQIDGDPNAIVHIGLNCSALNPSIKPTVYECVDSSLSQLKTRHYRRASKRPCIVHCQTGRIRTALEKEFADTRPIWSTVVSPCYFATYAEVDNDSLMRDYRLIVFAGRFAPEKNPLLFVEAIAKVHAENCDVRALMLGEGPLLSEIYAALERYNIADIVEVTFELTPFKRFAKASIFVSLQEGDNYGSQALLEAMGAGCAIIASAVGETERLVTAEVGTTVNLNSAEIAFALIQLLNDPVRTGKLGRAASTIARQEYSRDRYVGFLESLYSRAITKFSDHHLR